MKKFVEKLFGIDKVRAEAERSVAIATEAAEAAKKATEAAERAKAAEELAKMSEKDRATHKKEPWVGVLQTHINKDNIRNGFFELDWNEHFVLKLKQEGYGFDGDKDEEIVDRWFRELCANVVVDGDFGGVVNTGVIDINSVKKNNK
jgi:peptidoglycan hydrolase-like protein with peptidoglycan-binding domain